MRHTHGVGKAYEDDDERQERDEEVVGSQSEAFGLASYSAGMAMSVGTVGRGGEPLQPLQTRSHVVSTHQRSCTYASLECLHHSGHWVRWTARAATYGGGRRPPAIQQIKGDLDVLSTHSDLLSIYQLVHMKCSIARHQLKR